MHNRLFVSVKKGRSNPPKSVWNATTTMKITTKTLICIVAINLFLASSVSANKLNNHNKHGNSNHVSKNYKHNGLKGGHQKRHFKHSSKYGLKHRRYRHSPRPYVYYERPHRWEHRHHHAYDSLIITSGVIGFILGTNF